MDFTVLYALLGVGATRLWDWLWRRALSGVPQEHRTTDGGRLCPYPGMTDADLDDFERDMDVPCSCSCEREPHE